MSILSFIEWNVSREIFTIGSFSLKWYGLLFALGLLIGYIIMHRIRQHEFESSAHARSLDLDILLMVLVLGVLLGSRLYHVIFYQWSYYLNNPLEILQVWKGGLASHGGVIGILLALTLYTRKTGVSMLWLLDRLAIPIMLAATFIRIGNFMNSEILGIQTSVPWAVIFSAEHAAQPKVPGAVPRHPAQLYEALVYLTLFITFITLYIKTRVASRRGLLFGLLLAGVFTSRFFIEFVKLRQAEHIAGQELSVLNVGQWSSIPFAIAGVVLIILALKRPSESSS